MSEATNSSSPFRTILFAGDFGKTARRAFRVACSLARGAGNRLVVLHVEEPLPFGEMDVPVYVPGESLSDRALLLSQLRATYEPGETLRVDYRLGEGAAAEQIVRTADEEGCDVIVMGTHGRAGLDRVLAGSVAEAVMRRARCACLVVAAAAPAEDPAAPIRTILHPTDFSDCSEAALRVARAMARDHGARLVLLHVVPPEDLPGVVDEQLVDLECGHEALEAVRRRVDAPDLSGPVEGRLRRGEPAAAVLESAADLGCDLIVMGSHGRGTLGRLLMGSVATAVTRGAPCPVLIVKGLVPASPRNEASALPTTST